MARSSASRELEFLCDVLNIPSNQWVRYRFGSGFGINNVFDTPRMSVWYDRASGCVYGMNHNFEYPYLGNGSKRELVDFMDSTKIRGLWIMTTRTPFIYDPSALVISRENNNKKYMIKKRKLRAHLTSQ